MVPAGTLTEYWPSLTRPPAVAVLPSTGKNVMLPASGGAVLQCSRSRHRHQRVPVGDRPVDHVWGGAVGSRHRHELEDAVVVVDIAPPVIVVVAPGPQGFRQQQGVGGAVANVRDF